MAHRRKRLFLAVLGTLAGCDPGWSYHAANPRSERNEWSQREGGVSLRADGSLFAGSLSVHVDLRNDEDTPLLVDPAKVRVLDARNAPLLWQGERSRTKACSDRANGPLTLQWGEICSLRGEVTVAPFSFPPFRNRNLKYVTIVLDEIGRGGSLISRSVVLEWE